jgi:hypothetical protein
MTWKLWTETPPPKDQEVEIRRGEGVMLYRVIRALLTESFNADKVWWRELPMPKLCKDCASYGGQSTIDKHICNDIRNRFTDFIDGSPHTYDCSLLRNLLQHCGPEGKWWQGRNG